MISRELTERGRHRSSLHVIRTPRSTRQLQKQARSSPWCKRSPVEVTHLPTFPNTNATGGNFFFLNCCKSRSFGLNITNPTFCFTFLCRWQSEPNYYTKKKLFERVTWRRVLWPLWLERLFLFHGDLVTFTLNVLRARERDSRSRSAITLSVGARSVSTC